MKNKPFFRSFLTLLFALICMGGVSVTAAPYPGGQYEPC